ncbi:uncharacterized protein L3040_001080 [Drepanopeziza brunnea f. sp. 'multigermtubi']|uniref:uncharacterized protein n=1 Tax=Drepanopeziza brunnea f. sp. 'multigermtubi' TaxID=698441 RepID=UPI00238D8928|nr:hypothetical protein L3040_001080 [Drepanopeziza brunnea f. sp. 'multigermtubi']
MRASFSPILALSSLLTSSLAFPAMLNERQVALCSTGTPVCCDVDVLGVADLDCITPPGTPANVTDFNDLCAGVGKIDRCCILPILDQGILCSEPTGF